MGLDIYLYRTAAPKEEFERREKAGEIISEATNKLYEVEGFDALTQEQKDEISANSKALAKALAKAHDVPLDEYDEVDLPEEKVEINSAKYPEHYFKIGYCRSSYNSGGINNVMERMGLAGLYELFGYTRGEDYRFRPKWQEVKERTLANLEKLRADKHADVDIMTIDAGFGRGTIASEEDARKAMIEQLERHSGDAGFRSYSCSSGSFYLDGLKVIGMMPGQTDSLGRTQHCTYIAFRKEEADWYAQAMEIIIETCDYVLGSEDPEAFLLHWSS